MITIITPTIRKNSLEMVDKCLKRQTFQDFEWLVVSPFDHGVGKWIQEPKRKDGDYYGLNKAWNEGFRHAQGDLFVSIVDLLWFPPDTLERLYAHYTANPKACVTTIGHQYERIENGKPEDIVWQDPRARQDLGTFYEINPNDMELCVASIPMQAIKDVGGVDEEFDKYAALSEKEMCLRIDKAGYKFYIDQSIEYRALKHPRLGDSWDEHYFKGHPYYQKCVSDIVNGNRMKLPFLDAIIVGKESS